MKDPVETFPFEVLSPFFALFNTKELAILSAICRSWRKQIQTDIIINRILDLTRVGRDLSQDQTIELVQRLASLSSYPKNEIHISLQPFWETLERNMKKESGLASQEIMQSTSSEYDSLLSTISSATKGKLSKLRLLGPKGKSKNRLTFSVAESIIEGIFALDGRMDILDTVSLELPLPVSLESQGSMNFKLFQSELPKQPLERWELDSVLTLIKKVTRFTGSGLTSLQFGMRQFGLENHRIEYHREAFKELVTEVEKSRSTLKFLKMATESVEQSHAMWTTVIECNNLSRLHLSFVANDDLEQQVFFPSTTSISSLQELWIDIYGLPLNWTSPSLTNWIGTNLKFLRITQEESSVKIPMEFLKILLNRNPLLEDVSLAAFRISPSLGSISTDGLYLPRLKKLHVHRLDHLNELLSDAFLPSLLKLQFYPRDEEGHVQIPSLSDIFLPILQLCKSSISDLQVSDDYALENAELPSEINDVVELRQLVNLRFSWGSVNLVKLFSHFTFGKLKSLELVMQSTSSEYDSLLSTISSATKGKLSKLRLLGPKGKSKNRLTFSVAESIIEGIFALDGRMDILDTVSLELPLPVSLESQGSMNFKLFQSELPKQPLERWELDSVLTLIKKVTRFTGSGLTSLQFGMRQFGLENHRIEYHREAFKELVTEVEKSRSTLKFLKMATESVEQSHAMWTTVIECNNLSRLHLSFVANDDLEQQVFFPSTTSISSLQELWIDIYGLPLNWTSPSLTNWIGTNLKFLRITQEESSVKIPMEFLKILLNRNPLLEDVSLAAFRISPSLGSISTDGLYLPRLKKLHVHRLDHLNELLSDAFLPSLLKLQFYPRDEEGHVQIPSLSDIFLPILQLCKSSISDLQVSDDYALENAELPSEINDVVELRQLVNLRFSWGSVNLVKLFSHFTFGKLKSLELDRTSISVQDVARLLVGSHLSLETITIDGSKKKRKGKDVDLLRGCSFPKLKSLKLRKGSSHMLDLFGQASFGVLEILDVDYVEPLEYSSEETNLEQASFCSFLKIMESNFKSLKEASFNGTTKEKEEDNRSILFTLSFPALENLSISFKSEISFTLLVPFTTYSFPYLDTLKMSMVPPEPKQIGLEQVCTFIASTTDYLPDLVVSRSEQEIKVQAG